MRRSIAISLMMLFSWMLIAPLFASSADANLPACCRRNGKHHCMMRMMEDSTDSKLRFTTVQEKCPYAPAQVMVSHTQTPTGEQAHLFFAEINAHPALAPQTEAHFRISFSRSRQKRGPPSARLS